MRNITGLAALCALVVVNAADAPPSHNFSWLSGHWCAPTADGLIEEYWMPAQGDIALGVGRTLRSGRIRTYEFMRVQTRDALTNYIAIHEGGTETAFRLTASGADWARFENSQHDFPRRVEYRRTSSGLHAEIAGPGKDGKEVVIPFDYGHCVD
jgi:hypothetical protein